MFCANLLFFLRVAHTKMYCLLHGEEESSVSYSSGVKRGRDTGGNDGIIIVNPKKMRSGRDFPTIDKSPPTEKEKHRLLKQKISAKMSFEPGNIKGKFCDCFIFIHLELIDTHTGCKSKLLDPQILELKSKSSASSSSSSSSGDVTTVVTEFAVSKFWRINEIGRISIVICCHPGRPACVSESTVAPIGGTARASSQIHA